MELSSCFLYKTPGYQFQDEITTHLICISYLLRDIFISFFHLFFTLTTKVNFCKVDNLSLFSIVRKNVCNNCVGVKSLFAVTHHALYHGGFWCCMEQMHYITSLADPYKNIQWIHNMHFIYFLICFKFNLLHPFVASTLATISRLK